MAALTSARRSSSPAFQVSRRFKSSESTGWAGGSKRLLARQHGGGSLTRALEGVSARTLLIAFSSDWLYPPAASQEIADALARLDKPVELHVIDAPYGHDCFLLEEARQTPIVRRFLSGEGR